MQSLLWRVVDMIEPWVEEVVKIIVQGLGIFALVGLIELVMMILISAVFDRDEN